MPDAQWFLIGAKGHHGYPQPQNGWLQATRAGHCNSCGVYESQARPYRFSRSSKASHSHFRQLNWAFDAWFVAPEVEIVLRQSGLTGIEFGPALDHKSGQPLDGLRQLLVTGWVHGVETSRLPTVTCKPFNEERGTFGEHPTGPFCGTIKFHPPSPSPSDVVIPREFLATTTDLALTTTWFGSGFGAWHLTVASRRFMQLVQQYKWRGLEFFPIHHSGHSLRVE